ncbi:unnamed protein product [Rhizoctonia solani]|uniref:Uncharacterized protein n=1 Tax=Rhizoctonia solani TaxID=456999 RepID=A0A8H3HSQ8_9AGAM|nr:unnamed protein product [Rhizoctonia solani]
MDQLPPMSPRPVILGDTLSFNASPDRPQDLMECTVNWEEVGLQFKLIPHSDRYMVFKAKNKTAKDTDFTVPVFVQKDYYKAAFEGRTGMVDFEITDKWQYGQRHETGAGRFVVLHDGENNRPFQDRFIAGWLTQVENIIHGVACAANQAKIADPVDVFAKGLIGKHLLSYGVRPAVQINDILLVPSTLKPDSPIKITWVQDHFHKSADYYKFMVENASYGNQPVQFFIQKDWWDSSSTSEYSISKIAPKNKDGYYQFPVNDKSQYGEADESGQDRWVVYHDRARQPYQGRFVKSQLFQAIETVIDLPRSKQFLGINDVNPDEVKDLAGRILGRPLYTFY